MKRCYLLGISAILLLFVSFSTNAQESNRKLGTHNSMTYLTPDSLKMFAMIPFAKCQSFTFKQQYDFGVRLFDLRIRFLNGVPCFAHGEVEFSKENAYTVLDFLNEKGGCAVIFALENSEKIGNSQNEQFQALCKECLEKYPNVQFTGGWAKYPGNHPVIFRFEGPGVSRIENYKVFTKLNSVIDDAKAKRKVNGKDVIEGVKEFTKFPAGFATKDNPGYWEEWLKDSTKENVILMLDFVQAGAPDSWVKAHPVDKK